MNKDSKESFKEIKPAPFDRASENPTTLIKSKSLSLKTLSITLGLAVLLVSLIIVIFFLPDPAKLAAVKAKDN